MPILRTSRTMSIMDVSRSPRGREAGRPPSPGGRHHGSLSNTSSAVPSSMRSPCFPAEREVRRGDRLTERTIAGEKLDFTGHIDPRLVVEQSPIVPAGVAFPLNGWITVGRASSSDIVLDEHFVSSTHARFVPRGSFYYVEDLGSTNGTFVNEKQVSGEAQLKLDSRVRIGETVFRYEE